MVEPLSPQKRKTLLISILVLNLRLRILFNRSRSDQPNQNQKISVYANGKICFFGFTVPLAGPSDLIDITICVVFNLRVFSMKCTESEEEEPTKGTESQLQLSCFINQEVKYLATGLRLVSDDRSIIPYRKYLTVPVNLDLSVTF